MVSSQNGYEANNPALTDVYTIPGTKVRARLRKGPAATVLLWVASQFDARVEDIDTAGAFNGDLVPRIPGSDPSTVPDDWSYAERNVRGSATVVSNHASGTALDLNATQHPRGVRGTLTAPQVTEIRRILAATTDPRTGRQVVRWGGDYTTVVDEMHFEINADEDAVQRVADALTKPPTTTEDDMTADELLSTRIYLSRAAAAHLNAVNPNASVPFVEEDKSNPDKPGSYVTLKYALLWGAITAQEASTVAEQAIQLQAQQSQRLDRIEAALARLQPPA